MTSTHNCGVCLAEFATVEEYLQHSCSTSFTPTEIAHQDALTSGQFSMQAAEALKRGAARIVEETV